MVGRPAKRRGNAFIGMLVFVFISVICLGLFVFELTRVKEATERASDLQRRLNEQGSAPSYYADEAKSRNSPIFGVMADDLKTMGTIISGSQSVSAASIRKQVDDVVKPLAAKWEGVFNADDTLLTIIQKMEKQLGSQKEQLETSLRVAEDTQQEVKTLNEQLKMASEQFTAQINTMGEQVKQQEEEKVRQLTDKDKQLTELQNNLNTTEQHVQQLIRDGLKEARQKDLEIARLENQLHTVTDQMKTLKPSTFDPDAIVRQADGQVLRAIPGSDVAYINIGAKDKVKVGMGFEVYSQGRETQPGLRGKASLEVVSVMDNTSECRIARQSTGQPIIEGDYIVNIAYDRSRKPRFLVEGDFDLNFDGLVDFDGRDKIMAIIRQWGGEIVNELDTNTDFVVVGLAPTPIDVPANASALVKDQAMRKSLENSKFKNLVDQARTLGVPIVTQNQFLYMVGFAGDSTIIRR